MKIERVDHNAQQEIGGDRGIMTVARYGKNKAVLRVATAASTVTAAHAALQKPPKCSTGRQMLCVLEFPADGVMKGCACTLSEMTMFASKALEFHIFDRQMKQRK